MIEKERVDENGKHVETFDADGKVITSVLMEPSQKWIDKKLSIPQEQQLPTETEILTDYIIDVDYRVTMIELGL